MPFQSPGDLDFGQNSGHLSVPKGPNVKSAKLLFRLPKACMGDKAKMVNF